MSWTKCEKCSDLINVDDEPECYYIQAPTGNEIALEFALCEPCKEIIQNVAEKTVVDVRGSNDVPAFDLCVESEMQKMLVNLVR